MSHKSDVDENAEISRIRATVRQWRVEAAQKGKPLQLPVMPFLLRNIWTGALILFSLLTFSTFFISTVVQVSSSNIDADNTFIIMQGHGIYRSCWYVLGSGDVGAFCDHHGGIGPCLSIHPNLTTVRSCWKTHHRVSWFKILDVLFTSGIFPSQVIVPLLVIDNLWFVVALSTNTTSTQRMTSPLNLWQAGLYSGSTILP